MFIVILDVRKVNLNTKDFKLLRAASLRIQHNPGTEKAYVNATLV